MRVGADRELHPGVPGRLDVVGRQVEPLGVGVDLQRSAGRRAGAEQRGQVDIDAWPLAEPPRGRVPDDVHLRVLAGPQEPAGHLGPALVEVGVHRRHADVESRQEIFRPVDGPVGGDVQLGAVQQHHRAAAVVVEPGLQAGQLLPLGQDLLGRHPLHDQVRGVVGDGEVLVPERPRGCHHVVERGDAIGQVGVSVQISLDIGHG